MTVPHNATAVTDTDHDDTLEVVGLDTATSNNTAAATRQPAENTANDNVFQTAVRLQGREGGNSQIASSVSFGSENRGLQAGVINGNVTVHFAEGQSIFGTLVPGNRLFDAPTLEILAIRARIQAGRNAPKHLQDRCYAPYRSVKNRNIKLRLIQVANVIRFLDRGFAEYFQVAVLSLGKEHVDKLLQDARMTIAKMQKKQEDPGSADVGDLGHFCEQTASTWHGPEKRNPCFTFTHRRDQEIFRYLQDALEVPYWEFMVDIFLTWKVNSSAFSGDAVLRVLHSLKLDLLHGRRLILDEIALLQGDDVEDISPIIDGIDVRIEILDSLWYDASSDPNGTHSLLVSFLERPLQAPPITPEIPGGSEEPSISSQDEQMGQQMETATLIALILLFITAAIVPGYKAFALSMQDTAKGNVGDADFWYLIQSSIMAVMGNVIMVVPLRRKSWFSPAYHLMWVFFTLGIVFAAIAAAIYPLLNPGWSSMVAFFGSIASVTSVLIMTQATARGNGKAKVKTD